MQSLLSSLDALRPGSLFMERYMVEHGARRGSHTALIFGQDKEDVSTEVRVLLSTAAHYSPSLGEDFSGTKSVPHT